MKSTGQLKALPRRQTGAKPVVLVRFLSPSFSRVLLAFVGSKIGLVDESKIEMVDQ
jgi:hypothetical protein